jgi:hypothetical protein
MGGLRIHISYDRPEGNRPLLNLGTDGRTILTMDFKQRG